MGHLHEALTRAAGGKAPQSVPSAPASEDVALPWDLDSPASTARLAEADEPRPAETRAGASSEARAVAAQGLVAAPAVEKLIEAAAAPLRSVEQYRRIAAALHLRQLDHGLKVVMIASALPGEGKTLTAANVALTLSESYRRSVLLIDADLRRPTIHELFRIPNISGLNDGLKASEDRKLCIHQRSAHLSIVTAGRPDPDPMSGLSSERMRRVLVEAGSRFDWVLIDTPPIGLLPDAHLLSAMVDGIVLVVRAAKTSSPPIQRAIQVLGRDRILGVVLNRVEQEIGDGESSYYDEYHRYHESDVSAAGQLHAG